MSINNDLWPVSQDLYLIYCQHKKIKFDDKAVNLRSPAACHERYRTIIKSGEYMQKLLAQADWRPSEDLKLEKAAEDKKKDWKAISIDLGKEEEICEKRWCLLQAVRVHHAALLAPGNDNYEAAAPPPAQPEQPPKVSLKRTAKAAEEQPQRKKHEFDVFEPLFLENQ